MRACRVPARRVVEDVRAGSSASGGVGGQCSAVLIAYACRPGRGSEAGAGWEWVRAASDFAEVVLLSQPTEREDVERALAAEQRQIRAEWVKVPGWCDWLVERAPTHSFTRHVMLGVRYCMWQVHAGRKLRELEKRTRVDVVHHVTFASDSFPTALLYARAPRRIWGPVGGATYISLTIASHSLSTHEPLSHDDPDNN